MSLSRRTKADILESEVQFLRAQVAQLQNYILMVMPPQTTTFPSWDNFQTGEGQASGDSPVPRRLYTSEHEEDIEYALQEGLIDKDKYAELLSSVGALNDEIEIS